MKKYEYVLFDLDGTLTESAPGIINSVSYALQKFGIEVQNKETLKRFVGPPLSDAFENFYGFSHAQATKAIEYYREYFKDKGIYENSLYDGIPELLKALSEAGLKLIIATSKPELFAKRIAAHFGIDKYFSAVIGATMDGSLSAKQDIIARVIATQKLSEKESVIMVGDRHHDIEGAKSNGIDSIGVLYGYGSRNELENAGATYIASTPHDVKKFLLG